MAASLHALAIVQADDLPGEPITTSGAWGSCNPRCLLTATRNPSTNCG